LVDIGFQPLYTLDVLGLFREEGIEGGFVAAGGMDAPLDAELGERLDEAEAGEDDADGANDGRRIGDDLVAGGGDEIAARGGCVLDEDEDGLASLVGQIADALGDETRLDGRAARRIDDDGDGRSRLDGEGALEKRGDGSDVEPAGAWLGSDDAVQPDDG